MIAIYIIALNIIIIYTAFMNLKVCLEKEDLQRQLFKAEEDLSKIKLLNRLKVDWEGKPIRYEGKIDD